MVFSSKKYKRLLRQKYWIKAIVANPKLIKWYFHWLSCIIGQHSPLGDELPWVTYEAIDWMANHINKDMILFEWGSGGSTIFFSNRVKKVVSVEHDLLWYQEVFMTVSKKGYQNILLTLAEPERSESTEPWYTSTDTSFSGYSFEKYVREIDTYPDAFFDIVVVDGRARLGCMKHALHKIKSGGFLILDNSDRQEYQKGCELFSDWKVISTFGPSPYVGFPTGTTIWQHPF
jgi:hypothetical protein